MAEDPIIAEIHRIREQLWRECHGSAEEMAERQRRLQEQDRTRLIDPEEWQQRRKAKRTSPASRDRAKHGTIQRNKRDRALNGIEKQTDYWVKSSRQDLLVGNLLLRERKIRQGLFILHFSLEKLLKGLVCKAEQRPAPKVHSLLALAERAAVDLSQEQDDFLAKFDMFDLEGRYPDRPSSIPRRPQALKIAQEFKRVYRCLTKQLRT
jgi:HEPN domain-containing protein